MVENFTLKNEEYLESDIQEVESTEADQGFEAKVKSEIQLIAREPSQKVIDNILNYSKSLK